MINLVRKILAKLSNSNVSAQWSDDKNKLRILIRLNNYFTESLWNEKLSNCNELQSANAEVVYVKSKDALLKHFPEADACFVFDYKKEFSGFANKRKLVYIPSQGLDYFDDYSIPSPIKVASPPAFSAQSIAEYCVAMVFILNRNLQYAVTAQKKRAWNQRPVLKNGYVPLQSKTIGLMGVGRVGCEIAATLSGIGCKVFGFDMRCDVNNKSIASWFLPDQIKDFLSKIDILIIALPLNRETKGLVGYHELKLLRRGATIINVSRGEIVVERDLIRALQEGGIKGAALDVFEREPLSSGSPFYSLDNVIITPHIAGNINLFVAKIQDDFLSKIISFKQL